MKEVIQMLICIWEICMPFWFVGKWFPQRIDRKTESGLWYLCVGVCIALLYYQRTDALYSRWYLIFEIFTIVPLIVWKFRLKWKKSLLIISFIYESIYVLDFLMLILENYFHGMQYLYYIQFEVTCKGFVIHIISRIAVLTGLYLLYWKRHKILLLFERNWKLLFLIPAIQHLSLVVCERFFYEEGQIVTIRSLFLFLLIYLMLFFALIVLYVQEKGKYERRISEEKADAVEQKYQELMVNSRSRDILMHDIQNHLVVLEGLLRKQETERALDYIKKAQKNYSVNMRRLETGNVVVDTILENKISKAEEAGTRIKIISDDLSGLFVTDRDWCCILANLLDNAIEACGELQSERWIRIRLENRSYGIVINIENSCVQREVSLNDEMMTTKKNAERHGFGLQSVRYAIEKYNGTLVYECMNSIFKVNVILYG